MWPESTSRVSPACRCATAPVSPAGTDELDLEPVDTLNAEVCLPPEAAMNEGVEGTAEGKEESE